LRSRNYTTFDSAAFLAGAGLGRTIVELKARETFFCQGDAADKDEPLTAEGLTKLECNELRAFDGAARGVTTVDPGACFIWTILQQPYDDLYFYKYLTAVSAAAYFADGIEHGDGALRDRYFTLLKAGGSEDPYVLLKRAGFDARDPAAYSAIGHRFEREVDALERELRAAGRLGASSPATGR